MATRLEELSPEENLALLTQAVWEQLGGHNRPVPVGEDTKPSAMLLLHLPT